MSDEKLDALAFIRFINQHLNPDELESTDIEFWCRLSVDGAETEPDGGWGAAEFGGGLGRSAPSESKVMPVPAEDKGETDFVGLFEGKRTLPGGRLIIGTNDDLFFIGKESIKAIIPTVAEMDSRCLGDEEREELLEFEKECFLTFPCTIVQARKWAADVLGIELPVEEGEPHAPAAEAASTQGAQIGRKPIDWYAEHMPIEERARRGLLGEKLTITEIAALHPWGDRFACMLLDAARVSSRRAASKWAPVDTPPEWVEGGLHTEVTHGFFDRIREVPGLQDLSDLRADQSVTDARHGRFYLVHRADLRVWLEEVGLWPLPADAPLSHWWSVGSSSESPKKSRKDSGPIFEQRTQAFRDWLESKGILEDEYHRLKSLHDYSVSAIYDELKGYPAFKSTHGKGDPISKSTFMREFWKEQTVASCL